MDLLNEFYDLSKPVMCIRQAPGFRDSQYGRVGHYEEQKFEEEIRDEASGGVLASLSLGKPLASKRPERLVGKYRFDTEPNNELPVFKHRQQIVETINKHTVTILNGMNGCGKTTQIPQYILDDCFASKKGCNIIVTQPRRLAAITVAEHVSDERQWPRGSLCGYQIGLDHEFTSPDTRLLYCTTGVLKEKLVHFRDISQYSHIFLDEVHERTIDLDFVLLIIKLLLPKCSTKLILMSATMDPEIFMNYFSDMHCKLFQLTSPMRYKVKYYYMDDIVRDLEYNHHDQKIDFDLAKPGISDNMVVFVGRLIEWLDHGTSKNGILVFLPGYWEINAIHKELNKYVEDYQAKWMIIKCHSQLPQETQLTAFQTHKGYRKIILATEIAESSITFSDVDTVIDLCLTKQPTVRVGSGMTEYEETWASLDKCQQRAGRVGRVLPGRVYRLVPKQFFKSLRKQGQPEMERSPLEDVVLKTKLLDIGEPLKVLPHAINPPQKRDIHRAVMNLKQAGGLLFEKDGNFNSCDGDLTFIGRIMAILPVDFKVAKLIALGHVLGVLSDAIIIGACLTVVSGLFTRTYTKKYEAYRSMISFCSGTIKSDLLAARAAYQMYKQKAFNSAYTTAQLESWCEEKFLELRALREIDYLVESIESRLTSELNIASIASQNCAPWLDNDEKMTALTLAIAGAFYPNYYVTSHADVEVTPADSLEYRALKELHFRNPLNSVYLSNFPAAIHNQPGDVYFQAITDMFRHIDPQVRVSMEQKSNCQKVFIEFTPNDPSEKTFSKRICTSVYLAAMMFRCKEELSLRLMSPDQAHEWLEMHKKEEEEMKVVREKSNLPSHNATTISVNLVRVDNPAHFWSWSGDTQNCQVMRNQLEELLSQSWHVPPGEMPIVGNLYIYRDQNDICKRARVEYISTTEKKVHIVCIDYAERAVVDISTLFLAGRGVQEKFINTPALTFEIQLAEVEPAYSLAGSQQWAQAAHEMFEVLRTCDEMYGDIYSVVEGVIRIILYAKIDPNDEPINVNEQLIRCNHGIKAAESHKSQKNHKYRRHLSSFDEVDPACSKYLEESERPSFCPPQVLLPRPPADMCHTKHVLKGPHCSLQTTLEPLHHVKQCGTINISIGSVNTILMNEDPEEDRQQMIVSAFVTSREDMVTLHQTTQMPNVMGIASIMAVLFAPRVEYRPNSTNTRYASARCGMGGDERGRPQFPKNDFDVFFDTEFTNEEAKLVNEARLLMSGLLSGCGADANYPSRPEQAGSLARIRELFNELLRERPRVNRREYPKRSSRWGLTPAAQEGHIYPVHSIPALQNPGALYRNAENV